jgi:hypothetical protein
MLIEPNQTTRIKDSIQQPYRIQQDKPFGKYTDIYLVYQTQIYFMRTHSFKPATLLFVLLVSITWGCNDDDNNLTPEQEQVRKLSGSWRATSVLLNDVTVDGYNDFLLTLTGKLAYSVSGGPDNLPFPPIGKWKLGADINNQLIIAEGSENIAAVYTLDGENLIIDLNYTGNGFPNARAQGLEGAWTFNFTKN